MLLHSALDLMIQKEMQGRKESADLGSMRKQAKVLRSSFNAQRNKTIALQLRASRHNPIPTLVYSYIILPFLHSSTVSGRVFGHNR